MGPKWHAWWACNEDREQQALRVLTQGLQQENVSNIPTQHIKARKPNFVTDERIYIITKSRQVIPASAAPCCRVPFAIDFHWQSVKGTVGRGCLPWSMLLWLWWTGGRGGYHLPGFGGDVYSFSCGENMFTCFHMTSWNVGNLLLTKTLRRVYCSLSSSHLSLCMQFIMFDVYMYQVFYFS